VVAQEGQSLLKGKNMPVRTYVVTQDPTMAASLRLKVLEGPVTHPRIRAVFMMDRPKPKSDREHFDQLLEAAQCASGLLMSSKRTEPNVLWEFNMVLLETNMQHRGDFWAIYKEARKKVGHI
jgi:hypothetical protein